MTHADGDYASQVQRHRTRPVEVDAVRYDGPAWVPESERYTAEGFGILQWFARGQFVTVQVGTVSNGGPNQFAPALHRGDVRIVIHPGDYIVRDEWRGISVMGGTAFEAMYEQLNGSSSSE